MAIPYHNSLISEIFNRLISVDANASKSRLHWKKIASQNRLVQSYPSPLQAACCKHPHCHITHLFIIGHIGILIVLSLQELLVRQHTSPIRH